MHQFCEVPDSVSCCETPCHAAYPCRQAPSELLNFALAMAQYNSGAAQRIIKMQEMPVDPMQPPKFRHKKVPRGAGSPPVPVMHSPPRPVTVKEQQDWKIPPCISNWKNAKGYTIPLDKRLAADGRGLQEVSINDQFAKFTESLYIAEGQARQAGAALLIPRCFDEFFCILKVHVPLHGQWPKTKFVFCMGRQTGS